MKNNWRNILLTLCYNGANYYGYQVQEKVPTICGTFQGALAKVLGTRYPIIGCSRTDRGVHALDYKISMHIKEPIPCSRLVTALNQRLPDDMVVLHAQEVPKDFHARYHVVSKQYTYYIHNSSIKDPFHATQRYRYPRSLQESLMHREAQVLVGTHDFSAFCTEAENRENTVRTLKELTVTRQGDLVMIQMEGNGFLYNMVRIIVGSLIYLSIGRIKEGELEEILRSKDRLRAGLTAPAQGLFLTRVDYPDLGGAYESIS